MIYPRDLIPLRIVEFVQTARNGGWPVPSANGFKHGDQLSIMNSREFYAFLYRVLKHVENSGDEPLIDRIKDILGGDLFTVREDGEPPLPKRDIPGTT